MFGFSIINILLYFVYPATLISLSLYVSSAKEATVESYYYSNHNAHWFIIGVSLLTAFLCGPYIFGFAFSGANTGFSIVYGILTVLMLLVMGKYVVPRFLTLQITTLPDYFEKRFNRSCKLFISILYIVSNIFIRLLIMLVFGNIMFSTIFGTNAFSSLLFFLVVTGLYVIIGGLRTEFYASIVQFGFITLSALVFTGWFFFQDGGTHLISLNIVPLNGNLLISWSEYLIGLSILAFWFTCADQFIVQKMLSVKNYGTGNKAMKLSGVLQVIAIMVVVLPSVIAGIYSGSTIGEDSLHTFISSGILPNSLRGGAILGAASIFMISIASLFNSTSSLFTFDVYRSINPAASDRTLVLVGRLTTIALLFLSILFIPVCQNMNFDSCIKLLKILMYFSAMVSSVLIISMLINKIESINAILSFTINTIVICIRAVLENYYFDYPYSNSVMLWLTQSTYLEFSIFIFLMTLSMVFASFAMNRIYNTILLKNLDRIIHKVKI